jgi:uncharacterized RDD family membrane protein YckC
VQHTQLLPTIEKMIKITDLTEERYRTTYTKDAYGNRIRGQEDYITNRKVRTVKAGPRFGHFFIDVIAFQILIALFEYVMSLAQLATGDSNPIGLTIALISSLSLLLFYPIMYLVCESLWQQTPGKFLTQTIVIDEYGNKPKLSSLVLRSLIRLVPFEAFSCLDDNSYGWHDKWSDTYVVKKTELEEIRRLQKEQEKQLVTTPIK